MQLSPLNLVVISTSFPAFSNTSRPNATSLIMIIIIIIIKPYLSAHTQLSPYAQQIQTKIYNEKQYETNITKLIRNIKKISF